MKNKLEIIQSKGLFNQNVFYEIKKLKCIKILKLIYFKKQ